ncbi:MAG: hypothetical protein ACXW3X_15150 [Rhodoplanes sp.]
MAVFGWLYEHYRPRYDQLWKENWRLHLLDVYLHQGKVLYNAVWRPGSSGEIQIYGCGRNDFHKLNGELWNKDMRLHSAITY